MNAILYEHEDGRHAVAATAEAATFAAGDPKWHRVGPVDVSHFAHIPDQQGRETFAAWLHRDMPAGTQISDPSWWAPRIYRAVLASQAIPVQQGEALSDEQIAAGMDSEEMETGGAEEAGFFAGARWAARAALQLQGAASLPPQEAQPVARMLTAKEIDTIADRCDGLGDHAYERELLGKFCAANGIQLSTKKERP